MKNIIVFTHGIDIDGYACATLAKLAFKNPTIVYADNFNLDDKFENLWQNGELAAADQIYVTDHCPSMALCKKIDEVDELKNKILVLDHHSSRIGEQDVFSWVKIVDKDKFGKCCGASLFYDHLAFMGWLNKTAALDEFCEATRLYDTWEWVANKENQLSVLGNSLNTLSVSIGKDEYVKRMAENLEANKTNKFMLNRKDIDDIVSYETEFNLQLEKYMSQIEIFEFLNGKIGYVEIKDAFKNEISQKARDNKLEVDFLLMPIRDRGSISLRDVSGKFDLGEVAKGFGGGGHAKAASFPLENLPQEIKNAVSKSGKSF